MLTWKQTGFAPPVHHTECGRFTIEPGPKGHSAHRFDDIADVVPVESSDPTTLQGAKQWCEERVADPSCTVTEAIP